MTVIKATPQSLELVQHVTNLRAAGARGEIPFGMATGHRPAWAKNQALFIGIDHEESEIEYSTRVDVPSLGGSVEIVRVDSLFLQHAIGHDGESHEPGDICVDDHPCLVMRFGNTDARIDYEDLEQVRILAAAVGDLTLLVERAEEAARREGGI